jgi:hypothetical protein
MSVFVFSIHVSIRVWSEANYHALNERELSWFLRLRSFVIDDDGNPIYSRLHWLTHPF